MEMHPSGAAFARPNAQSWVPTRRSAPTAPGAVRLIRSAIGIQKASPNWKKESADQWPSQDGNESQWKEVGNEPHWKEVGNDSHWSSSQGSRADNSSRGATWASSADNSSKAATWASSADNSSNGATWAPSEDDQKGKIWVPTDSVKRRHGKNGPYISWKGQDGQADAWPSSDWHATSEHREQWTSETWAAEEDWAAEDDWATADDYTWYLFTSGVTIPTDKSKQINIKLSNKHLDDAAVEQLAVHLDSALDESGHNFKGVGCDVALDNNNIGDIGLEAIVKVLQRHEISIRRGSFYRNQISDTSVSALAKALAWQELDCTELHLSHNRLTAHGLIQICLAIGLRTEISHRPAAKFPCWVRLEHNNIAKPLQVLASIKKHGKIQTCMAKDRNICNASKCGSSGTTNVHLYLIDKQPSDAEGVLSDSEARDSIHWWKTHFKGAHQDRSSTIGQSVTCKATTTEISKALEVGQSSKDHDSEVKPQSQITDLFESQRGVEELPDCDSDTELPRKIDIQSHSDAPPEETPSVDRRIEVSCEKMESTEHDSSKDSNRVGNKHEDGTSEIYHGEVPLTEEQADSFHAASLRNVFAAKVDLPSATSKQLDIRMNDAIPNIKSVTEFVAQLDYALSETMTAGTELNGVYCDLHLNNNHVGDAGLREIIKILRRCGISLRRVHLRSDGITNQGAIELAAALSRQTQRCQEIDLSENFITARGLVAICMAIRYAPGCAGSPSLGCPCNVQLDHRRTREVASVLRTLSDYARVHSNMANPLMYQSFNNGTCANADVNIVMVGTQMLDDSIKLLDTEAIHDMIDYWLKEFGIESEMLTSDACQSNKLILEQLKGSGVKADLHEAVISESARETPSEVITVESSPRSSCAKSDDGVTSEVHIGPAVPGDGMTDTDPADHQSHLGSAAQPDKLEIGCSDELVSDVPMPLFGRPGLLKHADYMTAKDVERLNEQLIIATRICASLLEQQGGGDVVYQ